MLSRLILVLEQYRVEAMHQFRQQVNRIYDVRILIQESIILEFNDELKKLEEMAKCVRLTSADPEIQQSILREHFAALCHERNQINKGFHLHFLANPLTQCNKLYFHVAMILYPDADFLALFCLLLPDISTQLSIDITFQKRGEVREPIPSLSRALIDHDASSLKSLPISIESFAYLICLETEVFNLQECDNFDIKMHRKCHQMLKEGSESTLKNAIANHNQAFSELYLLLDRVNGGGATIREQIMPLVSVMKSSGKLFGNGEEFATERGITAVGRLFAYFDSLPPENQQALGACSDAHGTTKILSVFTDFNKQRCIESINTNLQAILENPANDRVLQIRPFLSSNDEKRLKEGYLKKPGEALINLRGEVKTDAPLSIVFTARLYHSITIRTFEEYVVYLMQLPPSQYVAFCSHAQFMHDSVGRRQFSAFGLPIEPYYSRILESLNSDQRRMLKNVPLLIFNNKLTELSKIDIEQRFKSICGLCCEELNQKLISQDPALITSVINLLSPTDACTFLQSIGFDRMLSELTQVIFRKNDESTTRRILKMKALLESIPENFRGDYLLHYDYSRKRMSQLKLGLVDWSKEVLEFPDCLKMCCDVLSATDRQDIMTRWIEKCAHHYENHDPIMDQLIESMMMAEADYNSTQLGFILMHDALLDKLLQKYPEGLQRTEKIEQYQLLMLTYNHHHRHKALKKLLACYPAEQHVAVIEKAYAMHASAQSPGAALLNMLRTVVSEEQHKMLVNCLINGQRFLFHVMKERNLSLFNWCLSLYTEHELMTLAREINLVREPGFGIRTKFCCGNMLLIAANLKVELLLAILEKLPAHDRLSALTVDTSIQALVGKYGAQCPELVKEAEDPNLIRFFQREVYPASPFSIISNNINVLHHVFKLLPDELYFDAFKRISVDCLKKLATKPEFISFMKEVVKRLDQTACAELLADQDLIAIFSEEIKAVIQGLYSSRTLNIGHSG